MGQARRGPEDQGRLPGGGGALSRIGVGGEEGSPGAPTVHGQRHED